MDKVGNVIMGIFGGVLTLAIIAVIISKKSQTPEVIQASASALANVIGAAVNPIVQNNGSGHNGTNTFSLPNFGVDPSQFLRGSIGQ